MPKELVVATPTDSSLKWEEQGERESIPGHIVFHIVSRPNIKQRYWIKVLEIYRTTAWDCINHKWIEKAASDTHSTNEKQKDPWKVLCVLQRMAKKKNYMNTINRHHSIFLIKLEFLTWISSMIQKAHQGLYLYCFLTVWSLIGYLALQVCSPFYFLRRLWN